MAYLSRAGSTNDLEGREKFWESVHGTLHNWTVHGPYNYMSEALAKEETLAKDYNCKPYPDDEFADGPWYVYWFEFDD